VEDAKVVRGLFSDSDHFAVVAKVRMRERWEFKGNGRKEGERRELASERLRNSEDSQRYERKVEELLSRARVGMEENACVSEVFETFKRSLVQATEVVGYKTYRRGKRGTAWWTQEIKVAVEEKRKAYKKMLQRNVPDEVRERRKREYRDRKALVKRLVRESKERVDEDFGRKLSAEYVENKKLFWREVRKEMGGRKSEACRMKRSDGVIVRRNEEIREVWKSHFEKVMNESMGGRAEVNTMGIKVHKERPQTQGRLERSEIMEAIRKLKLGKAPGSDGITAEMLKYGGEIVVDWMVWICNLAWEQSKVPEDWRKAIIVPLYKGKGNREECNNYRGISLLSVPGVTSKK